MTTRTGTGTADDEPFDTDGPRLRRRSNGAEYVVTGDMLVGRGLECDIVISDGDSISRRHARLSLEGETLHVADLGSTNGTHVNGREVTDRTALADGDVVAFDEYEFDVVVPPVPEPVDSEATRLVDRDALVARLGRDPFGPSSGSASVARDTAADPGKPPDGRDEPRPGGTPVPRDVVDDMADDDWTWPALDDDLDGPMIELADESSVPDGTLFDDAPEEALGEASPREDRDRESPDSIEPDRPEVAALPGAWANTTAVHDGNPEHTVIAKYVVPRPRTPPGIDPATLDGPALLVGTDEPAGQLLPLAGDRTEWIVGSGPASDLRIRHEGVSARHAVLSREGGKWRLCDELSVNGTYANGQRLNAGYVGDGDELRFGPVECRFVIPKGEGRSGGGPGRGGHEGTRRAAPAPDPTATRVPWKTIAVIVAVLLAAGLARLVSGTLGP